MNEATLMLGYGRVSETRHADAFPPTPARRFTPQHERCACGGWIECEQPWIPTVVQIAVQHHQRTAHHRAWARNGGVERMAEP